MTLAAMFADNFNFPGGFWLPLLGLGSRVLAGEFRWGLVMPEYGRGSSGSSWLPGPLLDCLDGLR